MSTFTQRVTIGHDRHIRIELDVPAGFPEGEAEVTMDLMPLAEMPQHTNRLAEICGKGKGKFWMSDDIDAPLDAFAEYR